MQTYQNINTTLKPALITTTHITFGLFILTTVVV